MKKIFFIFIASFAYIYTYAQAPELTCQGLPGCPSGDSVKNLEGTTWFINKFVGDFIKYIAAIAVVALMISGIFYLLSGGDEEKVKRAKRSIIWALVGVFISISAWAIINIVNTFSIPNS